jgi:hypothetical protein
VFNIGNLVVIGMVKTLQRPAGFSAVYAKWHKRTKGTFAKRKTLIAKEPDSLRGKTPKWTKV